MAEPSTVNRVVVGSSPTRGASTFDEPFFAARFLFSAATISYFRGGSAAVSFVVIHGGLFAWSAGVQAGGSQTCDLTTRLGMIFRKRVSRRHFRGITGARMSSSHSSSLQTLQTCRQTTRLRMICGLRDAGAAIPNWGMHVKRKTPADVPAGVLVRLVGDTGFEPVTPAV